MAIKPWDQEHTYESTLKVLSDLSTRHIDRIIDTDLREGLKKAVREGRYRDLVGWDLDVSGKLSVSDVLEARQALGFYQKLEPLDIGVDKEQAARSKFQDSETKCRETNDLFRQWSAGNLNLPRGVDSILHTAQRKIAKVLGRLPALSELDFVFGPGATTSVPRRNSCSRVKLSSSFTCSTNFLEILPSFLREIPAWCNNQVESWQLETTVSGDTELLEQFTVGIDDGRVAFVPKNAKTYRTVMTEPTLNTLVQGAYGRWIANRLRRVGQDITDQTRNQRLARWGSLTGEVATLDLSSASDTISTELVAHLLPYDWFSALDSCRTKTALDGDVFYRLEKFSSMGNGFTFPLQTLIFWALVSSCNQSEHDVSVYGDDIICPIKHIPEIFRVFDTCGFILNRDKSFWTGPFRESCGADYYFGVNVRPFYLKGLISFEKLFILHNHYVRHHDDEMAKVVLGLIPEFYHRWGPDGYGDGHLIGDWKPVHHKREYGWGGYLFNTFTKIGKTHTRVLPGDRVLPVYSIYVKGDGGSLPTLPERVPKTLYRLFADDAARVEPTLPVRVDKRGVVRDPLPGTKGYKETTIYTLTCA